MRLKVLQNPLLSGFGCCLAVLFFHPCCQAQTQTQRGAVTGGAAGAIIGGIVGKQNDRTAKGAVIGGVAGAVAGGLLGKAQDDENQRQSEFQQRQQAAQAYQMGRALSISDAINMTRSGISPNVIVSQIQAVGVQQEIGVQEIILMHENGVPEIVIQEMQRAPVGGGAFRPPLGGPRTVYLEPQPVFVQPAPVFYDPFYPGVRFEYYQFHSGRRGHYYGYPR
jgi:uncharacterized protein YcfJ